MTLTLDDDDVKDDNDNDVNDDNDNDVWRMQIERAGGSCRLWPLCPDDNARAHRLHDDDDDDINNYDDGNLDDDNFDDDNARAHQLTTFRRARRHSSFFVSKSLH